MWGRSPDECVLGCVCGVKRVLGCVLFFRSVSLCVCACVPAPVCLWILCAHVLRESACPWVSLAFCDV
jgi:hypothetical protein